MRGLGSRIDGPGSLFRISEDPIRRFLAAALRHPEVDRALWLFGKGANDWRALYCIRDVILDDLGNGDKPQGATRVTDNHWATENQLRGFSDSANSISVAGLQARHGVEEKAPANPMSCGDARADRASDAAVDSVETIGRLGHRRRQPCDRLLLVAT